MRRTLPKWENCRAGLRTVCCVWIVFAACLTGHRAQAQDASTNDQPRVTDAVCEPDAEVNTWILRAMDALRSEKPETALPLLVRVLRSGPDVMASTNGVTFQPARRLAAALSRTLPERALAAYRLQVRTAGKRLPGGAPPPMDVASLEASFRNELPGVAAAEAGLHLAGLYLDQERYHDARRILRDLLDEAPAGLASRSELLARLVVACARVGDAEQAEGAWAELRQAGATNRWAALGAELRPAARLAAVASNAWTMAYGGPSRDAVPPGPGPDFGTNGVAILRWSTNLGPGFVRSGLGAGSPTNLPPALSLGRSHAMAQMTEKHRRPSDDVIFAGNRAWVNGFGDFIAVDLDSGAVLRRTAHPVYNLPPNTPRLYGTWIFDNRLNRAAGLIGGRVYGVEDNCDASLDRMVREKTDYVGNQPVQTPLPCGNTLAAYEADTGRLLWRIGRELPPKTPPKERGRWQANAIRFAAPPVPCAGLLLAPVEEESWLSVVALDANTGRPVWRTRVAYSPPAASPRAAPVTLTVDGVYAYLCSGRGLISVLDGCDGAVRWTTLYEPFVAPLATNDLAEPEVKSENTWEESVAWVVGETVVALPEDASEMMAFDRRSGAPLWTRHKPEGVNYVVGRQGAAAIVAGRRAAACVDLTDGRERWRTPIAGSTGRGALSGREVLVPFNRTILRLRAEDGAALGPVRAQTPEGLPLGNLYVNGDQLLVAELDRLAALVDARPAFARLQERLAQEPTAEAYAERSGLYAGLGRYTEALADLREAWKRQRRSADEESVRAQLLAEFGAASARDSGVAEVLYAAAVQAADRAEAVWRLAQYREQSGNTNGALSLYAAMLSAPDVPLAPAFSQTEWEVSARRLAAQRIRKLLGADEAKQRKLLEELAAQALARLASTPAGTALVEVATCYPGTAAGKDAALAAAQLAVGRGDLGTAEAILQRGLDLAAPSDRAAVAGELVRLYERMKWPRGLVNLRDNGPWRKAGARAPEFIEAAASNAAVAVRAAADVPLPPWRLRWRGKIPAYSAYHVVPAGLVYWDRKNEHAALMAASDRNFKLEPTAFGCLSLETGQPRWRASGSPTERWLQKAGWPEMPQNALGWPEMHLLLVNGVNGLCMDLWSGACATNRALSVIPENWFNFPIAGRSGVAAVIFDAPGGGLSGVDLLTGQVVWRRSDFSRFPEGRFSMLQPLVGSEAGSVLVDYRADRSSVVASPDPTTGAILSRRAFDRNDTGWYTRKRLLRNLDNIPASECGDPILDNERLTAKSLRTGATVWTSPPDLAIAKHEVTFPGGYILARTTEDEMLLLDRSTGKILSRSDNVHFAYSYVAQSMAGDAVIALRAFGGGTNDIVVLDPAIRGIAFQCRLPQGSAALQFMGAKLPGFLLTSASRDLRSIGKTGYQSWIQVINEKGETPPGWRLPRVEDCGDANSGYQYAHLLADGLILMLDNQSGNVLAYEHDSREDTKKP